MDNEKEFEIPSGKDLGTIGLELELFREEDHPIDLDAKGRPKKTVRNKRAVAVRNKAAGSAWEYSVVDYLKSVGYLDACTTRGNSKYLDGQKVDFMNKDERSNGHLPFNLQAKQGAAPDLYRNVFADMPRNGVPNIIAFKYTRKAKSKFMTVGEFALMDIKTWLYYIELERKYKELRKYMAQLTHLRSKEEVADGVFLYNLSNPL